MFDLKTIVAANKLAALAERLEREGGGCPNPWPALGRVYAVTPETHATKAFNRRVALYARDAGVTPRIARAVLTLKDREQRVA